MLKFVKINGKVCVLAQVFNVQTLIVKFFSCVLAVGSGLPVGPEGPMVHIGAMIGAALSQGHSTTLGFTTGLFRRFQNPKDKRDFVTAGAHRSPALCPHCDIPYNPASFVPTVVTLTHDHAHLYVTLTSHLESKGSQEAGLCKRDCQESRVACKNITRKTNEGESMC